METPETEPLSTSIFRPSPPQEMVLAKVIFFDSVMEIITEIAEP